jgi:hypothetical protein
MLRIATRTLECMLALFKESTVSMFLSLITKFLLRVKEMIFSCTNCFWRIAPVLTSGRKLV